MLSAIRTSIRTIGHEERISTVDHLDELRTRLIASIAVVGVAFGFCFWQNHALLRLIDRPLAGETQTQVRAGHGPLGATYAIAQNARDVAIQLRTVVGLLDHDATPETRDTLNRVQRRLHQDIVGLSAPPDGEKPVTLGIGEPLTTTITISLIFALVVSLPFVLFQACAFLLPAFEPAQRRAVRRLLLAVPFLFVAGVLFGYFVVLPTAVHFLLNFNSAQFNVLVQASQYYKFAATTLLAMGLLFQVPVGIMAITRGGIITPQRLRKNRRYAIVACGAVAAFLPGDAVTLLLETVPLYLLFEVGVLLAALAERRAKARAGSIEIHAGDDPISCTARTSG
ncbi:MAG TPA: twin-arginine translocase subunit TatC [Solirubrobacteraceae bacterium]|nr:twin-arginine translocase subunit TatC [Solirubrobacteraceae bacterium]